MTQIPSSLPSSPCKAVLRRALNRPGVVRLFAAMASMTVALAQPTSTPFRLADGDRVVFVGDTLIEREAEHGYWEAALTARFSGSDVLFRNLGWAGDNPVGQSRVSFDWTKPPSFWRDNLIKQVVDANPTVLFVGYGMAASFDTEPRVFIDQLTGLLDAIEAGVAARPVRIVILSPIKQEKLPAPLPDPAERNRVLARFNTALERFARERGHRFVSLFDGFEVLPDARRAMTSNGIHLTEEGYALSTQVLERGLGLDPTDLETLNSNAAFTELRNAIKEKNRLFFYRWRPQNTTYLFGFRKHEQGRNAIEIPQFDPLVAEKEEVIAGLRDLRTVRRGTRAEPARPASPLTARPLPKPSFDVAPGFKIELYAENPLLAKPIHMNFDPEGRLWVASSAVYPQIKPGEEARDMVLVLEDTNHDGVAESSVVFADDLLIPTGIEPGDGGVYVGQSTQLLHLSDTDGDGRADRKRIVLSGFGTEDTHHILHTLYWGPDGGLYMNQSIYIHSHLETPHGVTRLNSGGILRLDPAAMAVDVLLRGLVNSWGHQIDAFGQSFATDGAGFQGIHYVVPGAMYVTYAGARRIMESISPGNYPKFCGLEMIYSDQFPEDWRGNVVTCDFRAHRVVRFSVSPRDSGYVTESMPDLVRTSDVNFRPIDVKLGPDGALYIADWSNPIIQHGEVDFRDPRRDHEHGRIWRVSPVDRPAQAPRNFTVVPTSALLDLLTSPNGNDRKQARRVLIERGETILPGLADWVDARTPGDERALLEALWLYQALHQPADPLLNRLLNADDHRVRAAAIRVLAHRQDRVRGARNQLAQRVRDDAPRVRLEAVRALGRDPSAEAASLVLSVLDRPMDSFLDYAVWLTINEMAEPWLTALENGEWPTEGRENQLAFALQALEPDRAKRGLQHLLDSQPLNRQGSGTAIELIGQAGDSETLNLLFDRVADGEFDPPATARALESLNHAARFRNTRPTRDLGRLRASLRDSNRAVRTEAIRLAGAWKDPGTFVPELARLAGSDPDAVTEEERSLAFTSLRELRGPEAAAALKTIVAGQQPDGIRIQAVIALAAMDLDGAAPLATTLLGTMSDESEALGAWRALLQIRDSAAALTRSIPGSGFSPVSARAGMRAARESGRVEPELVLALSRGAALEAADVRLSDGEIRALGNRAMQQGDPHRGEEIYRRTTLGCVACHAIGGAGGKVGPDMTSIGASAPIDYLIESIFYPNRKIKEGYHAVMIKTEDGREISGVLVQEDAARVLVRNAINQEVAIPKNTIVHREISSGSLMPSGLADSLSEKERVDLFRFLAELGKPGPFDASKGNVARYWEVRPINHQTEQFAASSSETPARRGGPGAPAFTLTDGRLPRAEIEERLELGRYVGLVAAEIATQLEVPSAGPVRLTASALPSSSRAWVDGQPVVLGDVLTLDLDAGTHTVRLRLDPKNLPEHVRLESDRGTFLTSELRN